MNVRDVVAEKLKELVNLYNANHLYPYCYAENDVDKMVVYDDSGQIFTFRFDPQASIIGKGAVNDD